jgi:NAD+ synthase (glutamine-hydrolysing)
MNKISLIVTQASLNQTALDWARNLNNIYKAIDEAVSKGADILSLEELTITGYEVNDDFQRTDNKRILECLDDIAAYANSKNPELIISVGHPWRLQLRDDTPSPLGAEWERVHDPLYGRHNKPFNVQTLIHGGKILGMTAKSNLYIDGRGYEGKYFNQWSSSLANQRGGKFGTINIDLDETGNRQIPFGCPFYVFTNKDGKSFIVYQIICESKWVGTKYDGYPHDDSRYERDNLIPYLSKYLDSKDGLVIINPNASPPSPSKILMHEHIDKLASQYSDLFIDTDGLGSSGSTFSQFGNKLIAQHGEIISRGKRIIFDRTSFTTTQVEISVAPPEAILKSHVTINRNATSDKQEFTAEIILDSDVSAWDHADNPNRETEETIRNTALWLFDYLRKSGQRGIAQALSGGADSTFNSAIAAPVMISLVVKEKSAKFFCDELGLSYAAEAETIETQHGKESAIKFISDKFIINIYMGTNNSSSATFNAAKEFVLGGIDPVTGEAFEGIGGEFINRNVQDLINFYAMVYAVENTTKLDPQKREAIFKDLGDYLNINHFETPAEEIRQRGKDLIAKYPEIDRVITNLDGTAIENLQARARTVLLNMFANKYGLMPLTNSNLDEICNGYATFAGDMHAGPINLNGHLGKYYQKNVLMKYLQEKGLQNVLAPLKALGAILKLTPSAELLPKDKSGKVTQTDEGSLQRSFEQMRILSIGQQFERIDETTGSRRMNASELYEFVKPKPEFDGVSEDVLFNMVVKNYERWNVAQWKIHASTIAPTNGHNVDHQTSLRTPNLSGGSWDEIVTLGVGTLYKWAERDNIAFLGSDKDTILRRSYQDQEFIKSFRGKIKVWKFGQDYSLERLYNTIKEEGWAEIFPMLANEHPSDIALKATQELKIG